MGFEARPGSAAIDDGSLEMMNCARTEALERLAEYGVVEDLDWWLAWSARRQNDVVDRLVDGLRTVFATARENKAPDIARIVTMTLRRAGIGGDDG